MRKIFLLMVGLAFLITVSSAMISCGGKSSPTGPGVNTPTVTSTPQPIVWAEANVNSILSTAGSLSQNASLDLLVNGAPNSSATVVLTGTGISSPVTLPYAGPTTYGGAAYSLYQQNGSGWTYQPGLTYVLKTITSAGTAAVTQTAPGGISVAINDMSVTWNDAGNYDSVEVQRGTSVIFSDDSPVSPFTLPATIYSTPGTYYFTTLIGNTASSPGGTLYYLDQSVEKQVIVGAPTPTATITGTGTPTSSPTITPTGTITFLPTSTPTATPSVTTTPTATSTHTFQTSWSSGNSVNGISYSAVSGGIIYLMDEGSDQILRYSTTGTALTSFGSNGSGSGQFNVAWAVSADSTGGVYVSDADNNRVQKLDSTGAWVWTTGGTASGIGNGQFNYPAGNALDGSGNLYVMDSGNSRIEILNATTGAYGSQWSGTTAIVDGGNIALDTANSYVYIVENGTYIAKYTLTGTYQTRWQVPSGGAYSTIAIEPGTGNIFAADFTLHQVEVYSPTGTLLTSFGQSGPGGGFGLDSPWGIAFDGSGNIYVADPGDSLMQVFNP